MSKLKSFILESAEEIKEKISWPKYRELQSSSILVVVASLIFAIIIGLIDLVFKNVISWFYNTF